MEAVTKEGFKKLLDRDTDMQGMEGDGSRAGRGDYFNSASCSVQT